jgi:uncharacterized OsmC-like protein
MKSRTSLSSFLVRILPACAAAIISSSLSSCSPASGQAAHQPTLADFQGRRAAAVASFDKIPDENVLPVKITVRTTAEQRSGVRRIRIRHHQVISDSDYSFVGYSLGPGSPESSLTAIASDLADAFLTRASIRGVRIDSLGVSITSRRDTVRPAVRIVHPHNLLYTVYVKSPATDEVLEEIRLEAEKFSPAFNIASVKQTVNGSIDYAPTPKDLTFEPPYQPGLREYLKYKRAAILSRNNARPQRTTPASTAAIPAPEQRETLDKLHVEVDPVSGARKVHIRHFNFLHDNDGLLAGSDLGPSSIEHQLGALTSCITHITEIQAATLNIVLDSLSVSAEAVYDRRAGRPGYEHLLKQPYTVNYTVHYRSPHSYEEIVALRDAVEAVCPIYNLFISEQTIEGRTVRSDPDAYRIHPQPHELYRD